MASQRPGTRRERLHAGEKPREARAGCLITGAVLGIIVGATFAFYGLPPILRSIYGEKTLAPGETYSSDAKVISVVAVEPGDITAVTLSVRTNKSWALDLDDIRLEVAGQDGWLHPLPPDPALPATAPGFPLGQQRELLLRYEIPPAIDGTPLALHLADPRIRFELGP